MGKLPPVHLRYMLNQPITIASALLLAQTQQASDLVFSQQSIQTGAPYDTREPDNVQPFLLRYSTGCQLVQQDPCTVKFWTSSNDHCFRFRQMFTITWITRFGTCSDPARQTLGTFLFVGR